jgi:pantoate kinase
MQADIERLLARLYTDPQLRERFLDDAAGVAQEAGLSPSEAEAVAQMSAQDLGIAARSYQSKRASNAPGHATRGLGHWLRRLVRR